MSDAGRMFSDGATYERQMGRWSQLVAEQFLDWLDIPKGLRWLDVGCGNGAFTEILIGRCAPSSVIAIDPSEGQLAYARTRAGTKIAEFRLGDAQTLPMQDAAFDAAVMALVIAFVPDAAKTVAEMARVVRPGGFVATYMWDMARIPNQPLRDAMISVGIPTSLPPGAANASREAMQGFWQGAGIEQVETRVIRIPVVYSDFDDFWNSNVVPVGPQAKIFSEMSPSKRQELRDCLLKRLPIAPNGRIAYEAVANAVKGRAPQ